MSRVAKAPITVASGVTVNINGQAVEVKGPKGTLTQNIHSSVAVELNDGVVTVKPANEEKQSWAHAGTARALINNMVTGVNDVLRKN
jgi:large subunit ribosomal protein L6